MKACAQVFVVHRLSMRSLLHTSELISMQFRRSRRQRFYNKNDLVHAMVQRRFASGGLSQNKAVKLALPRSYTHEGLAYAACPICRKELHLQEMFLHLTTLHKFLDVDHCERICNERLALYRRVIGTSLKTPNDENSQRKASHLALLPTLTSNGAYLCNWCVVKLDPFPTRDAFLKHTLNEHPEVKLEDIEPHISLPRSMKERAISTTSMHTQKVRTYPEPCPSLRRPTRSLAGVAAVPEVIQPTIPIVPRQTGVSIPKSMNFHLGLESKEVAVTSTKTQIEFSDSCFPCELCGRAFSSEIDLLRHLEARHADGSLSQEQSAPLQASSTLADTPPNNVKTGTPGSDDVVYVACDLCSSSKVYTTASALFSHMRLKHPFEDADLHVERLIEAQRKEKIRVCMACYRGFSTQEGLDDHVAKKHGNISKVTRVTSSGNAPSLLGPVTSKNQWWCCECERGFSQAKSLYSHMVNKHQLPTQAHPCPSCKRIFTDVFSLEEHFSVQHKGVSLSDLGIQTHTRCQECDRLFITYGELHRHAVRHHKKDPRKPERVLDVTNKASSVSRDLSTSSQPAAITMAETLNTCIQAHETHKPPDPPRAPRKVLRKKKS